MELSADDSTLGVVGRTAGSHDARVAEDRFDLKTAVLTRAETPTRNDDTLTWATIAAPRPGVFAVIARDHLFAAPGGAPGGANLVGRLDIRGEQASLSSDGSTFVTSGFMGAGKDRKRATFAFDVASGKLRWSADVAGPVVASPVDAQVAACIEGGELRMLDLATGALGRSLPLMAPPPKEPPCGSGLAYSPDGSSIAVGQGKAGTRIFHGGASCDVPWGAMSDAYSIAAPAFSRDGALVAVRVTDGVDVVRAADCSRVVHVDDVEPINMVFAGGALVMSFERHEIVVYGANDGRERARVYAAHGGALVTASRGAPPAIELLGDAHAARRFGDCVLEGRSFPLEWCESRWLQHGLFVAAFVP
jgi:hypothetical protein